MEKQAAHPKKCGEVTLSITNSKIQELYKLSRAEKSLHTEWTLYFEATRGVYLSSLFSFYRHISNTQQLKNREGEPMSSYASGVLQTPLVKYFR